MALLSIFVSITPDKWWNLTCQSELSRISHDTPWWSLTPWAPWASLRTRSGYTPGMYPTGIPSWRSSYRRSVLEKPLPGVTSGDFWWSNRKNTQPNHYILCVTRHCDITTYRVTINLRLSVDMMCVFLFKPLFSVSLRVCNLQWNMVINSARMPVMPVMA